MKNQVLFFTLLLLSTLFITSCDKIEEATTVEFTATYDAELQIDAGSRNTDGTFSAYATIDPRSDSEFNKYMDKIKDIEVISVSGNAVYVDPAFLLQSAKLLIYSDKYSAEWNYTNFPVNVGTVLTMGNESGQWDTVSDIANEKSIYHLSLTGSVDVDELSCTIVVTIKYKVKAGAL